jgi:ATP-binding cassette subfamily F protein uup
MAPILTCQSITKSYASRPLFRGVNLAIEDNDKLGLIGPNGAGKSTLLKIMAGIISPDDGKLTARKGLRTAYIPQDEKFAPEKTIGDILADSIDPDVEIHERETRVNIMVTRMGFPDVNAATSTLSGGWRKRLSIASKLITEPDVVFLDEPTNHLDLDGVLWLEKLLNDGTFPFVLVTHDRTFLENVCNRIAELNAVYADGCLSVNGAYTDFLVAREEYLAAQAHLEQAIASKVRREIAWLQRGARARQTKAQARIDEAERLIDALAEVKFRNAQTASVDIDFSASGRKTKELLVGKHLEKSMGERLLFNNVNVILSPGVRLGLIGANGSGKTTFLKVIDGQLQPDKGTIKRADALRVVVFDQNREQLDQTKTLRKALSPVGDMVTYQGRPLHVATWAKKFLFRSDQLDMPISYLSGGEQARILIANLMLRPADILMLDEPTNDLDIPSLEVLEESLQEFAGAVVLVTHDRFMLDSVSTLVLALDGKGGAAYFADYAQWQNSSFARDSVRPGATVAAGGSPRSSSGGSPLTQAGSLRSSTDVTAGGSLRSSVTAGVSPLSERKKLSTNEKRELSNIEQTIEAAESEVKKLEAKLSDPTIASNHVKLQEIMQQVHDAQQKVQSLYDRWQDLEARA